MSDFFTYIIVYAVFAIAYVAPVLLIISPAYLAWGSSKYLEPMQTLCLLTRVMLVVTVIVSVAYYLLVLYTSIVPTQHSGQEGHLILLFGPIYFGVYAVIVSAVVSGIVFFLGHVFKSRMTELDSTPTQLIMEYILEHNKDLRIK